MSSAPKARDIWSTVRSASLASLIAAPLLVLAGWYAVPLRLIIGSGFVEHGYAKLSRGADGFIAILHAIGMPLAHFFSWATIAVEIVGGALIFVAAFVPVAAVPMMPSTMAVSRR